MTRPEQPAAAPARPERIVSLDISRAIGTLLVLAAHLMTTMPAKVPLPDLRLTPLVILVANFFMEQFFAMSGFLIGGILLRDVAPHPTLAGVWRYLVRRCLRIVPAYYAMVAVLVACEFFWTGAFIPRWKYFFFLQNYPNGAENFLDVSWTLSIEFWSYLLLPVILIVLPRFFSPITDSRNRRILLGIAVCIGVFVLARLVVAELTQPSFDVGVRKQIHLRLDALLFGLLVACAKAMRPEIYRKLASTKFFGLVVAAGLALLACQYADHVLDPAHGPMRHLSFHASLGFSLMDLLVALSLPFLDINPMPNRLLGRVPRLKAILVGVSACSFSLYLVHLPIIVGTFKYFGLFADTTPRRLLVVAAGFLLACLVQVAAATWLLYRLVEKPGMNLRKRFRA